ncbi:hypothetical protein CASFOL_000474 [Castilleja foliolosa]|uniref:Replication factor A C-terminal domain-containing protein n=1 Tax=Castilleja foliolosa TaxID=1961234 RepID=A0ABD3ENU0_9LAMI
MALWSLFKDLHAGSTTWGIKVRIVRLYKLSHSKNASDNEGSMELVLHDESLDRIHCSMDMDIFKKFQEHLVEGGLCCITHLLVKDNDWKGKSTTNKHRLCLNRDSKVLEFKCSNFPSRMHELKEFHELSIPKKDEWSYQLIDVIGRVTSYQQPTKMPSLKTSRMDFKMVDTSGNSLDCSLWDEYIDMLLPKLEHNINNTCIVLFRFGRVCEMKFQNTHHITHLIVNGDDDVFNQFRTRMETEDGGGLNKLMFSEEDHDMYVEFSQKSARVQTLSCLKGMKQVSNYWVEATILDIDTKTDYWYLACKTCDKKVYVEGSRMKCWTCREQTFTDTYRYKVHIVVQDPTGYATLLLWNRECAAIIGKSAGEMRDLNADGSKMGNKMVEKGLIHKKLLFEVKNNPYNNNQVQKDYFIVTRVVLNEDTMEIYRLNQVTDEESTAIVPTEKNYKRCELLEVSSKEADEKGKGLYIEDAEHDIDEQGVEDAGKVLVVHDDELSTKKSETMSESVAKEPIYQKRASETTTDATYMLKKKRITKEKN